MKGTPAFFKFWINIRITIWDTLSYKTIIKLALLDDLSTNSKSIHLLRFCQAGKSIRWQTGRWFDQNGLRA
ncbi:hypothetical protein BcDW1_9131 [Botrytis cinerea BcDW1]|uniref:Uncharacterized protein n=1 Tax=Botryotinia fuckeliana (strain BcDW1) TaxID=1290391 RepID=M7U6M1_BOTF1|nr:hypothetical protein BcDW1_9131 [Botrytis cinerea BcDW1]